jgi:two-component SAPR family response regulator
MSGFDPQQMRRESMRIGVDDFLDKPFSIQELDRTIEARLKRFQELRLEQADIKAHIAIRTLGAACARKNGQIVNHLPLRALEMLCLLLEHPKGMRIFELGEAMWSGLDERRASNNFHATLHRFRQAFGKDVVEKVNGHYQLSKHVNVSYDAQLLCQLDPSNPAHRSRALELYQGDFLSDSQSLWVIQRREELARHFKQFEQRSYATAH